MLNIELLPAVESDAIPSSAPSQNEIISVEADALIEGLPAGEVHKRALAARRKLGRAQRSLCFYLQEVEKRRLFGEFGCSSTFHYAEIHLQLSPHTISELLRIGRELERFPLIAQALSEGKISTSKVKEISRVAVEETEKLWLGIALKHSQREIEKLVAFTPKGGLPFGGQERSRVTAAATGKEAQTSDKIQVESRQEEVTSEPDGKRENGGQEATPRVIPGSCSTNVEKVQISEITPETGPGKGIKYNDRLMVELSGEQMAVVSDALRKARKESGLKDRASLLEFIAKAYLTGATDKMAETKVSKPPYQIVLHSHPASGMTWCESLNGERYLDSLTLEKAICDAEIIDLRQEPDSSGDSMKTDALSHSAGEMTETEEKVPMGQEGRSPGGGAGEKVPMGLNENKAGLMMTVVNSLYAQYKNREKTGGKRHGHKKRATQYVSMNTIPRGLRRKILLRDQYTCQNPGCRSRLFIVIHHIIPLGAGGENVEYNLLTLCSRCHELVHLGKLTVSGLAPHGLIWSDERGDILRS